MGFNTLVVNLWAGPGTGKSTNAALVFGKLKVAGVQAELVHEYAKDLTWEHRIDVLGRQSYVMAKQQHHIERVMGQVEVIVTDSPLPFSIIYGGGDFTEGLRQHILEIWGRWNNLNVFLARDDDHHPYVEAGRNQTLEEAMVLDARILALLGELDSEFILTDIQEGERTADDITEAVVTRLRAQHHVEE